MTLNTQHSSDTNIGNSATTAFPITFQFYSPNDIVVFFDNEVDPPVNQSPSSYVITGGGGSTGTITFTVAPPAGIMVIVSRVMSFVQQASYTRNDPFPSATHEIALDRIVMMVQQVLAGVTSATAASPEFVQDIVGTMLTLTASTGIEFTYDDALGIITAVVTEVGIIDAASDGKYYVRRNAAWIEDDWTNIVNKPATFPPSTHTHPAVDITDFTAVTQDIVAPMFNHSGHTNFAFVYDGTAKKLLGIAVGSGGSTKEYNWLDSTALLNPGSGNIAADNANLNAVTHILVSQTDAAGDSTNFSTALIGDTIVLNDLTRVAFGKYLITAISYGTAFIDFTVTVNASISTGDPQVSDVINASLVITNVSVGLSDVPADGINYGRKNTVWSLIDWTDVVNKPGTFAPSAHDHPASDITDFAEAVDDRLENLIVAGPGILVTYNDVIDTLTIETDGAPAAATISDTAPGSPIHGDLWWNSSDANLYIYYNDGSSSQWVIASLSAFSTISIPLILDNGANPIPAGAKVFYEIPFACILTGYTLLSEMTTTAVLDVWVDSYANYPPTVGDTITAAAKPTLSAAMKSQDNTIATWTKSIAAGSIVMANVDSNSAATKLSLSLRAVKI